MNNQIKRVLAYPVLIKQTGVGFTQISADINEQALETLVYKVADYFVDILYIW